MKATFEYQTWKEGQPLLVLVVDDDFDNNNYMNVEISGIEVNPASSIDQSGDATLWLIGSLIVVISLMGVAFYILRRGGDDYYYDEDYDDYDDEQDHE